MKLMIAGDIHGNTSHVITVLDNAVNKGCDRIFAVGDFGAWEHMRSGVDFFDDVNRHAVMRGVTVYFLDGNHDKTSLVLEKYNDTKDDEGFLLCRPHVRYAPRGHRWTWEGKNFIALGGAYSVDKDYRLAVEQHEMNPPGTQWFPEEEMTDEEMDHILRTGLNAFTGDPGLEVPLDVMLTHDKPRASSPGWNRKDIPECWPNQDRIQRAVRILTPQLLIHGHLHYPYEDRIRHGEETSHSDGWTQVIGLDSDASSSYSTDASKSWTILEWAEEGSP